MSISRRAALVGAASLVATKSYAQHPALFYGVSSQVEQFFDRLIELPSSTDQAIYSVLINNLVSDGVWSSLDVLTINAGPTIGISLINLVSGSFQQSLSDFQPNWTQYRGFNNTGAQQYVSTGYNPSTAAGNFTRNSGLIGIWNLGVVQKNGALLRSAADVSTELWPLDGGKTLWMLNSASEDNATNSADTSGWFVANRTGATATAVYRNNTQLGTASTASVAPENNTLLLGYGVPTGNDWQIAASAIGAGMTAAQMFSLYNRVQACLHAFGAV